MATRPDTEESWEVARLRSRLGALEEELTERTARANAAVAAAEDRAYWLDRWNVDLNAIMRRPIAGRVRALLRGLRLVYRKARELGNELPWAISQESDEGEAPRSEPGLTGVHFGRAAPEPLSTSEATDILYSRLPDGVDEQVEATLSPDERESWDAASPAQRRRLALHFGVHHGVAPVLESSGLTQAAPPEGVHAMASGSRAAGGSLYYADLVSGALREAGLPVSEARGGLDFGCSSGRVVRALAAAFPDVEWHGTDPIAPAIEWASENLPGIEFRHGPERPPLPSDEAQFDFAFAISIWSHFAEPAAVAWLEEMRRIVRPGGLLVLTTAGWQTVANDFEAGLRSAEQLSEAASALYHDGFWFHDEFGEAGDFGVKNPDWGTAFMTPDWLLARATPRWRLAQFAPGRVEGAQDLLVLERR
jgi:SAM-dependent methyltransferase